MNTQRPYADCTAGCPHPKKSWLAGVLKLSPSHCIAGTETTAPYDIKAVITCAPSCLACSAGAVSDTERQLVVGPL